MSTIRQIHNLVVLHDGLSQARNILSGVVNSADQIKINSLSKITAASDSDLNNQPYKIDDTTGEIKLTRQLHKQVVDAIISSNSATAATPSTEYELQGTGKYENFTEQEQSVQDTLSKSSDILERVFNRRTGLLSWIFAGYAASSGLTSGDNFKPVREELKNNPEAAQKAAKFFAGDKTVQFDNERQKKLIELASTVKNICNFIPEWFVNNFAKYFVWVNISSPWIAHIFKNNAIGKFFTALKCINPLIDEFISIYPALCGDEVLKIQELSKKHGSQPQQLNTTEVNISVDGNVKSVPVQAIELLDLDQKGYEFKKAYGTLNSGVSRLVKPRNLAGWIIDRVLKSNKFENWNRFEKEYVSQPDVVKKVYEQLQQLSSVNNKSVSRAFNLNDKFQDEPIKQGVATGAVSLLSIINSLPRGLIEKAPRYFGLPFSIIYTVFPTLSVLIGEKGFFGKLVGWTHRLAPLINDCFVDIIASIFEEAIIVKNAMEQNKDLYKGLPKGKHVISEGLNVLKQQAKKLGKLVNWGGIKKPKVTPQTP